MLESLVFSGGRDRNGTGWCTSLCRWMAVGLGSLTLAACTTTPEPQIVVKEVKIPVMVPCAIDTVEPTYVADQDSLLEAAKRGADAAVALLLGERAQRIAWGEGIKRQAEECRD